MDNDSRQNQTDIDARIAAEHYNTASQYSYDYDEPLLTRLTSAIANNKLLLIPIIAIPVIILGSALGISVANSNKKPATNTVGLQQTEQNGDTSDTEIITVGDDTNNDTNLTPTSTNTGSTQTSLNTNSAGNNTSSGSTNTQVQIDPNHDTDLDVCPNVSGVQTVVPSNLTLDNKGNCVAPPNQDVCPNIVGIQISIPTGKVKDAGGNCVDLAQDLCKNITGLQTKVPTNYVRDSSGNCTLDMCLNINGLQVTVPNNYTRDSKGNCAVKPTPASKVDLRPWKVTLPVGSGGNPIEQAATKFYSPWYVKTNSGYVFYVDSARATARTTNSPNVRSELRELQAGQSKSWSPLSGVHQLLVRLKVTKNTGASTVVIAQIHGDDNTGNSKIKADDTTVFRLEGTKLWLTRGDTSHGCDPHITIKQNQIVTIGFKVTGGKVYYYYSPTGAKNPGLISGCSGWAPKSGKDDNTDIGADFRDGVYFKTGNYQQSAGYGGRSESAVTILGLGLAHNSNGALPDIGGK